MTLDPFCAGKERALTVALFVFLACSPATGFAAERKSAGPGTGARERFPAEYFRHEIETLEAECLADIHSLEDWESRRGEYRRQLQEMLGLWPMPERTPLAPVITGTIAEETFTVEKLHFQASPGLYVTANLYVPKNLEKPAPAVLYVCGHAKVVTNGVSCGNKANYQHHGIWLAENGYVCLMIDTLQYGEILGNHRGTYSDGQWWWNSRGYSPAGVEAWFGIRAIDYLCSRPEVDPERIGMTGRSGGGSYTWTVPALDERVRVAAPIAGITDMRNQVIDGAVEGHCDCMFFVNTYRWDFPLVAALIAPRPLLHGNSDSDRIFPLDGVIRTYEKTRAIYSLYGAQTNLGLVITPGPHKDTQDLQVPVFRWFNKFLKEDDSLIAKAAEKRFGPEQLRVFKELPKNEVNTSIERHFVPQAGAMANAARSAQLEGPVEVIKALREKVFAAWPQTTYEPGAPKSMRLKTEDGLRCSLINIQTQPGVRLPLYVVEDSSVSKPGKIHLTIVDGESWTNSFVRGPWSKGEGIELTPEMRKRMKDEQATLAFFVPRGVTPAGVRKDQKTETHLRRRYMLLGATLDSMRVWDIRCAVGTLKAVPGVSNKPLHLIAQGQMGVNAAYAALFEPAVEQVVLDSLPTSHAEGPDYLNVLRVTDIPQVLEMLGERLQGATANNAR